MTPSTSASFIDGLLKDREALLRVITDHSLDLITLHDPEGAYQWVSSSMVEILGYTPDDLIGVDPYTLFHPDDAVRIRHRSHEQLLRGETPEPLITYRIRHKDGHYVWLETLSRVVFDAEGEIACIHASSRDVSERQFNQDALRLQEERLQLLNEVTGRAGGSAAERIEAALALALQTLKLDAGIVSAIDTEAESLTVCYVEAPDGAIQRGQVVPLAATCCSITQQTADVLAIHDLAASEYRTHPCYETLGLAAYIGDVLVVDGVAYGTLSFSSTNPREAPFTESDRNFVRVLSQWVASVLEQQHADRLLREREAFLSSIYTGSGAAIFVVDVAPDGDFFFAGLNPIHEQLSGLSSEALEGLRPEDLDLPPEIVVAIKSNYEQCLEAGASIEYEEMIPFGGKESWWLTRLDPLRDEDGRIYRIVGTSTGITERKQAEEVLRESEARLNQAQSIAHLGGWEVDLVTGENYWSDEFFRICGLEPGSEEPSTELGLSLIHPDDRESSRQAVLDAIAGESTYRIEKRIVRPNGAVRYVLSAGEIVRNADGTPIRLVGSFLDITERKRYEHNLQEERRKAEAAVRAKSDFLAKMSHEIRTPMNGVLGMTELMLGTPLSAHQRRYAETIATSGEVLLHLIDDVLDMSKIEAGQLRLEEMPLDLRQLIAETVELFAGQAEAKGLRLIVHIGVKTPQTVIGDPYRLRQVLSNLIANALKFTDEGEVCVSVTLTPDGLRFQVSDTGIGIAPEAHARLFEAFEQAEDATTRKFGGTGLGLSISQQLLGMMEGRLHVTSKLGEGATFYFTLDLEAVDVAEPTPTGWEQLSTLRILIVGGSQSERTSYREQLEHWGATVREEESAPGALQQLCTIETAAPPYHVVIVDQDTPVLPGLALIQAVRSAPSGHDYPFLLLSGVGETKLRDEAAGLGIACLSRPLRHSDLLDTLSLLVYGDPDDRYQGDASLLPYQSTPLMVSDTGPDSTEWPCVLVAEDNPVNQSVVEGMLTQLGYAVDIAVNGREAVEKLRDGHYAAVLMDCQMPVLDGLKATQMVRNDLPGTSGLPIIALTANVTQGYREECLSAGMDDYLPKPFKTEELASVLASWITPESGDGASAPLPPSPHDPQAPDGSADADGDYESVLLRLFIMTTYEQLEVMRHAYETSELEGIVQGAHSIKGSAGMCGAKDLAEYAMQVEACCTPSGTLADVGPLLEQMTAFLEQFEREAGA